VPILSASPFYRIRRKPWQSTEESNYTYRRRRSHEEKVVRGEVPSNQASPSLMRKQFAEGWMASDV